MKLPNQPRVLAATYNPVSKTKMFSVMVDFPTVLLAELRTHRILTQGAAYEHSEIVDLSLSANSARAIPHKKYVERVLENPFTPVWTEQQKGMSGKLLSAENADIADHNWKIALKGGAVYYDEVGKRKEVSGLIDVHNVLVNELGVHKQNANRLLAPFAYTTCILSGTEWENFFELRCPKYTFQTSYAPHVYRSKKEALAAHPPLAKGDYCSDHTYRCNDFTEEDWQAVNESGAQPEFQIIAEMIYDLYREAKFEENEYHIPFEEDIHNTYGDDIIKKIGIVRFAGSSEQASEAYNRRVMDYVMLVSASLCAKLSYDTQDKEDTLEKHIERAQLLKTHKHAEPFSHQAVAMLRGEYEHGFYKSMIKLVDNPAFGRERTIVKELGWCYNNRGFISQRYLIENLQ